MSHYFETPEGPYATRDVEATIWGRDYTFATAPGVFSASRLDPGTAALLERCAPPDAGPLLDLGCGFGAIAVALAAETGLETHAVDVNDRALELTRLNAERHGVGVLAFTPDDAPSGVEYAEIWSNPPVRIGKPALRELLSSWLPRLAPGGVARLVVARNLGADSLLRWLIDQGWRCERLASRKGYRILSAR